MMLKSRMFLTLFVLLIIPALTSAQEVIVTKTAPSQINLGDNLKVTITIANNQATLIQVSIQENIGDAQAIEPQLITSEGNPGIIAARPPYFQWSLNIDANSQNSVSYTIKPNKVGDYLFSPTVVTTSDGKTYYSNTLSTQVTCNQNNNCEADLGEDYTNCPSDCKPPSADNNALLLPNKSVLITGIFVLLLLVAIILLIALRRTKRVREIVTYEKEEIKEPEKIEQKETKSEKKEKKKVKLCNECGHRLAKKAKFCPGCGKKIDE